MANEIIADEGADGLDGEMERVHLVHGNPVERRLHVVGRDGQRLVERTSFEHGAHHAGAPRDGQAAARLEAGAHERPRVVIDHGEQAQRHLSALRLAHHALGVEPFGGAAVAEVRNHGQQRVGVARHAVLDLGLVHVGRAQHMAVLHLAVHVARFVFHGEPLFLARSCNSAPAALRSGRLMQVRRTGAIAFTETCRARRSSTLRATWRRRASGTRWRSSTRRRSTQRRYRGPDRRRCRARCATTRRFHRPTG